MINLESNLPKGKIVWESRHNWPSTRGYRSLRLRSSQRPSHESNETFWGIQCNFKLSKFINYLKMERWLHPGQDPFVSQFLFDTPGFFADRIYLDMEVALLELNPSPTDSSRLLILQRLQVLQQLLGVPVWSYHLLNTWKHVLGFNIKLLEVPIRKFEKYSGYAKTPSAVGNKHGGQSSILEPETVDFLNKREVDFKEYFMSESLAPSALGYDPGTLSYQLLEPFFKEPRELPIELKHLIYYEPLP